MKTLRFDNYKHKMTKWVTTGIKNNKISWQIVQTIEKSPMNSQEYHTLKTNFKTYNTILKKYQES